MQDASIIPDGCDVTSAFRHQVFVNEGHLEYKLTNIIGVLPSEADLEVMILRNQLDEPFQQVSALSFRDVVDMRGVLPDREDTLPP